MSITPEKDRAEIRRLVDGYALAMDDTDVAAFSRLFTPDGALVVYALGIPDALGEFRGPGPEGIGLVALLMGDLYDATLHHITTHQVEIDGDRATGSTYCLAYHVLAGETLETLGVRYADEFIRTDEGWRIGVRRATRLWSQSTATPREPLLVDRAAGRSRRDRDGS